MSNQKMVEYLQEVEQEDNFIPWDDVNHAALNLVTVFGCTFESAISAALQANVTTKQQAV